MATDAEAPASSALTTPPGNVPSGALIPAHGRARDRAGTVGEPRPCASQPFLHRDPRLIPQEPLGALETRQRVAYVTRPGRLPHVCQVATRNLADQLKQLEQRGPRA